MHVVFANGGGDVGRVLFTHCHNLTCRVHEKAGRTHYNGVAPGGFA